MAERLGRTVSELEDMTYAEYMEWVAYDKIMAERRELARIDAENAQTNARVLAGAKRRR